MAFQDYDDALGFPVSKVIAICILAVVALILIVGVTGCLPKYDKPEYQEIGPSETAFMLPMEGKTSDQAKFESEKFLEENKVAAKRVRIPHTKIRTGRWYNQIKFVPAVMLIKIDRAPVTREWTEGTGNGTTNKNEGITAQSSDGISYLVRVNCTSQIDEPNAARYLYRYRNKELNAVMDTEIRPMVEKYFVEAASKKSYDQAMQEKFEIMADVNAKVQKFFTDRGVTITVLGLKGDFTPKDPKVAAAYASVAAARQEKNAQREINEKLTSEAEAKAKQARELAKAAEDYKMLKNYELREKELVNQKAWIEKWSGNLPNYMTGSNSGVLMNLPAN